MSWASSRVSLPAASQNNQTRADTTCAPAAAVHAVVQTADGTQLGTAALAATW